MAFLLAMTALIIVSGHTSINAVGKAELFPAHIRALGVALPRAIANALFGGTAANPGASGHVRLRTARPSQHRPVSRA